MKRFKILPVAIVLVLMVAAVSCTPVRETGRDYDERVSSTPGRIYVDDPYRGTVVLERDPYTGRYYEVNSYGTYYGNRYGGYDPYYRNRYYQGNTRTYRTPRQYPQTQTQPQHQQPSQEQIRQREEMKDEARRKVLGNKS